MNECNHSKQHQYMISSEETVSHFCLECTLMKIEAMPSVMVHASEGGIVNLSRHIFDRFGDGPLMVMITNCILKGVRDYSSFDEAQKQGTNK